MKLHTRHISTVHTLTFWHFQIAGWLLFWCGDIILILLQRISPRDALVQALDSPLGFVLALGLRLIYRRLDYRTLSIPRLLAFILLWSIATALVWHLLMTATRYVLVGPRAIPALWNMHYTLRWLSRITPVWIGWSTLYFGIKYWRALEGERKRAQDARLLAHRARLQMLRYQVNPHFLFNVLNSVRALIGEDAQGAKAMISELSEFLHYSLTERDDGEVTLEQELSAVRHYLSIEKKRFEENLDIAFEIDTQACQMPILSFLLHPFVENAVKHGMKTSPTPLRIRIQACAPHGILRVVVANTGSLLSTRPGGEPPDGTGTGLENVRARLQNAYPGRHMLDLNERDGWVEAVLEIGHPSGQR